jgi:TonB family protein
MKFIFTAALLLVIPLAEGQSQNTEHWSISNVQLIAVKEINGTNGAYLSDKSGLIEVTGNVSYLPDREEGTYTPLPLTKLVGSSGPMTFSVAPIAFGMNSPSGCHYYFMEPNVKAPPPAGSRLDALDGKIRFSGNGAVSLCFAFSTAPSPEMMHFEFSGLDILPEILTVPRRVILAPSLENIASPTPPKCTPTEPKYTEEARQAHIQGPVTLDVVVHSDGTIEVMNVLSSLGYGLDEEAKTAITKWKCVPGTMNGKPVSIRLKVVINFHLV